MSAAPITTPVERRSLPVGGKGTLWAARPAYGVFEYRGRPLRIEVEDPAEVLFPTDCGLSLVAALNNPSAPDPRGLTAFDLGCGSGLYTVALLAGGASHVTAMDVNAAAAGDTLANVARNGLDVNRVTCVAADLASFTPVEKADLVVTNPPHLPYDPRYSTDSGLETALVAGREGRGMYDAVVARIDDLLVPGGRLVMAHSSLADVARTISEMRDKGYEVRTIEVCEMDIPLESYAEHKEIMLGHLEKLRADGRAEFEGERFMVHALEFTRPSDAAGL
ncbi:methyltransferase [Streptomyces sp. JL2001]|uniref:methyltransferase n=1 Tax=Streptomyces sp. JL2001 TaxID=3342488 RepID=UPI003D800D0E